MRSDALGHARLRRWLPALWLAAGCAWAEPVPEHEMKAAFVFNFAVFAEWPADSLAAGAPLAVCANTASPLYAALSQLKDRPVNGHPISVRAAAAPLRACHVLVLERGDRERWLQWKRDVAGAPVLTVADDRVIGADGVVITMTLDDKRIGFDVDMSAARSAHLNLSSKLLRLARSVQ